MREDHLSAHDSIGAVELPKPPKAGARNAALSGSKPTLGASNDTYTTSASCSSLVGLGI